LPEIFGLDQHKFPRKRDEAGLISARDEAIAIYLRASEESMEISSIDDEEGFASSNHD
jgi:hypothetical protein